MNTEYKNLLNEFDWKAKCYHILFRDNYICQDCHRIGIQNETFFPITQINDLNKLFPNSLFNGKTIQDFCNDIQWDGKSTKTPFLLDTQRINDNLYLYRIYKNIIRNPPYFFCGKHTN